MIVESMKEEKMYVKFSNNVEAEQKKRKLSCLFEGNQGVMSRSWHLQKGARRVSVFYDAVEKTRTWKHA
ncbi:hypothetical protein Tco_1030928 [Tanacetum coccineum]|uniref:Uncharacterized protein n=1 Tax=Tanacetum coccineum TaxID=301880 RepID=A0ABQ5G7L1_9ASTR